MRYVIGECVVDTERFVVERSGQPVHVQPQVFDVLAYLLDNADRMVPKEEVLGLDLGRPVRRRVGVDQPHQVGTTTRRR